MDGNVLRIPLRAYDLAANETVLVSRYLVDRPMEADDWRNQMFRAQKAGGRISYSGEWSGVQKYLENNSPDLETLFGDCAAWTGTVLDFDDETLKEGITLSAGGAIAGATTIRGKKDGILLPHSNSYVKDLDDRYMPLIACLYGVKSPKKNLPDYAYIWAEPEGKKPVARGGYDPYDRDGRRVYILAGYEPGGTRLASWMIYE